jgi:hypothetical protein
MVAIATFRPSILAALGEAPVSATAKLLLPTEELP